MTQEFHENPLKFNFMNAASSNYLTEVSKWLSSLYKAILPVVNDLLVAKLQEAVLLLRLVGVLKILQVWLKLSISGIALMLTNCGLLISQYFF